MTDFMRWYWDWGIFVSGIIVFIAGYVIGWHRHKEKIK